MQKTAVFVLALAVVCEGELPWIGVSMNPSFFLLKKRPGVTSAFLIVFSFSNNGNTLTVNMKIMCNKF